MNELFKRIKSGGWVAFAGFTATLLTLVAENIAEFQLSERDETIALIILTAIVSQITKYLNRTAKK